ncbi:hypothetical protein KAU19_05600 [Candidatus Parcubacteria bacterium]|nr:hypothetical protein [Candidatus Parcubacteria bacterium]
MPGQKNMKAILEIKKHESPYKIIRSPWLKDSQGPVLFKLLSKKCCDGEIETVYVVERKGGRKTIIAKTTTSEEKFIDAVNAFRSMIWKLFPDVDLKVEDVEPINASCSKSTSQFTVAKNTKWGFFWLRMKKWLRL